MTVIRSNRWGFGIHSPFVYRLVTGVIFGKSGRYRDVIPLSLSRREKGRMEMIIRMIEYFEPERISIAPGYGYILSAVRNNCTDGIITFPDKRRPSESYGWLSLGADLPGLTENYDGVNGIHIFPDLQRTGCRDLFLNIQNDPRVSVTVEVNRMGIVIYNPFLQKQNFFISNWLFI